MYRTNIDTLDFQLLDSLSQRNKQETEKLLKKRVAIVKKLAVCKKRYGISPFDTEREGAIRSSK